MNKRFSSHHGAAMGELVIAIAFFAVISVFLLRIFMATEKQRNSADMTSNAVIQAESVMEYILASDEKDGGLTELGFTNISADGRPYYVRYFDRDWQDSDSVGKFMMTVIVESEDSGRGKLVTYNVNVSEVNVFDNSGDLFSLSAKKYECGGES